MSGGGGEQQQVLRGQRWPRFAKYVLEDGFIAPAPGAKLEWYDPWEDEHPVSPEAQRSRRHELFRIVNMARDAAARSLAHMGGEKVESVQELMSFSPQFPPVSIGRREERALLEWCAQNGLLGVLHHETLQVFLPPIWAGAGSLGLRDSRGMSQSGCVPVQTHLRWDETHWNRGIDVLDMGVFSKAKAGCLVPGDIQLRLAAPPGSTYRSIRRGEVKWNALPGRWSEYLPGLETDEAVRGLGTDENWRHYREPLTAFMEAATVLERACKEVESSQALEMTSRRSMDKSQVAIYEHGVTVVNRLASVARSTAYVDEHLAPRPRWSSPSLLGVLAMTTLFDLWGGGIAHSCANCGTVFISKAPKARFCTVRCRSTYHKRQWRKGRSNEDSVGR